MSMASGRTNLVCIIIIVWSLIMGLAWNSGICSVASMGLGSGVGSRRMISFPLNYIDADTSPMRSAEADPSDLPMLMPMRRFVAAGRALWVRVKKQEKQPALVRGKLSKGEAEFYLTVPVGSPPQDLIFIADTGSEFIWSQCSPCILCNGTEGPSFAMNKSSSFVSIPCANPLCSSSMGVRLSPSCAGGSACTFDVRYGDGSEDKGFLAVDSFGLGSHFSKPFVFGCATYVLDTAGPSHSSGLIGLSAGPFSFPSQLFSGTSTSYMPHKFAYCLPDRSQNLDAPGTILFGDYKLPPNLRHTPFSAPYSPLGAVYYYVQLQGITVGRSVIKLAASNISRPTIFDSGTTLTSFVKPVYEKVVEEMKRQTAHLHPFASRSLNSDLCYNVPAQAKEPPNVPLVVLHFAGKVDLELGPGSLLAPRETDGKTITFCLAMSLPPPSVDSLNIVGSYQQQNYWVEYNLQKSSLGLAKAPRCPK